MTPLLAVLRTGLLVGVLGIGLWLAMSALLIMG